MESFPPESLISFGKFHLRLPRKSWDFPWKTQEFFDISDTSQEILGFFMENIELSQHSSLNGAAYTCVELFLRNSFPLANVSETSQEILGFSMENTGFLGAASYFNIYLWRTFPEKLIS